MYSLEAQTPTGDCTTGASGKRCSRRGAGSRPRCQGTTLEPNSLAVPKSPWGGGKVEEPEVILAVLWLLAVVAAVGAVGGGWQKMGREHPSQLPRHI